MNKWWLTFIALLALLVCAIADGLRCDGYFGPYVEVRTERLITGGDPELCTRWDVLVQKTLSAMRLEFEND